MYAHTHPNNFALYVQLSENGKSLVKTLVLLYTFEIYICYADNYPM